MFVYEILRAIIPNFNKFYHDPNNNKIQNKIKRLKRYKMYWKYKYGNRNIPYSTNIRKKDCGRKKKCEFWNWIVLKKDILHNNCKIMKKITNIYANILIYKYLKWNFYIPDIYKL